MKWPASLTLIRHAESVFNALRAPKQADELYREFQNRFDKGESGPQMVALALKIKAKFALNIGDYNTPLTAEGERQALVTGQRLREQNSPLPDVILYSPYLRTKQTLAGLTAGYPTLGQVTQVEDDRAREQEHGLSIIYGDWRVFQTLHPEQRELRKLQGDYWYQYPQGESVAQVRDRVRSLFTTLVREYNGARVLLVTHHLTILSIRATLERLTPEEFIRLDHEEKPVNCGVTVYTGVPHEGKNGRLKLTSYNTKLY